MKALVFILVENSFPIDFALVISHLQYVQLFLAKLTAPSEAMQGDCKIGWTNKPVRPHIE